MAEAPEAHKPGNGQVHQSQREEVFNFMLELERNPQHAEHVRNLSMQLFDALQSLHGYGQRERYLLEYAALLHDVGWSIAGKKHHKHSMRLILSHDFQTLGFWEQAIVAQIARYHRKSMPKQSHNRYTKLQYEDQQIVCYLASILRIADALDRNKQSLVKKIQCEFDSKCCRIHVICSGDMKAEYTALAKKKNLFVKTFGLGVEVVQNSERMNHQGLYVCAG